MISPEVSGHLSDLAFDFFLSDSLRFSDFDYLRGYLLYKYPSVVLPPLPEKKINFKVPRPIFPPSQSADLGPQTQPVFHFPGLPFGSSMLALVAPALFPQTANHVPDSKCSLRPLTLT